MIHSEFSNALKSYVLLLDGAMATELMHSVKKPDSGCFDELCIIDSESVAEVHRNYLNAGADIITTNTFNSNRISLCGYGFERSAEQINEVGARIARSVADEFMLESGRKCWVAGSVGPVFSTDKSKLLDTDEIYRAYYSQMSALIAGGVDILLIETVLNIDTAECALRAAEEAVKRLNSNIVVMISATLNINGTLHSGESLSKFAKSVNQYDVSAIGLNCGCGMSSMTKYIRELALLTSLPILFYPGVLNSEKFNFDVFKELLKDRCLNIIGGCCGSTVDHIRQLSSLRKMFSPRPLER